MANPLVTGMISITLGVKQFLYIMLANVFIPVVKGVNTTTWSTGDIKKNISFYTRKVALWAVVSLGGIIGIVYGTYTKIKYFILLFCRSLWPGLNSIFLPPTTRIYGAGGNRPIYILT